MTKSGNLELTVFLLIIIIAQVLWWTWIVHQLMRIPVPGLPW